MTITDKFSDFNGPTDTQPEEDLEFLFIAPKLYKWDEHIEVMALGMEDNEYKRGWRIAKPVGEHTTGFLLAYNNLEEYYECHDEKPFVIARRNKKDA